MSLRHERPRISRSAVLLPICALVLACGGGGGGGTGSGLMADFQADPVPASDIGMEAGPSAGPNFDVRIVVTGPFNDFFGGAFRVEVPSSVELTGTTTVGSFLMNATVPPAQDFTFDATQVGNEIFVVATRLQSGTYIPGVDVANGATELLIILHLRVTAATAGDVSLIMPRQVETCDDVLETCDAVPDASLSWSGGTLVAN